MQKRSQLWLFLWLLPLLLASLACRAATRLILPDTPTPTPLPTFTPTLTPVPTIPPATPTPVLQAACLSLLDEIMDEATRDKEELNVGTLRPGRDDEDESMYGYLVEYTLKDDKLWQRDEIYVPDDFEKDRDTRSTHELIWEDFAVIIPAEERVFVTGFSVMTDGREEILGGVYRTYQDPTKWGLRVDVVDAENRYSLVYTLLHEFGHLLTMKTSQVAFDKTVFYNPDDQDMYDRARSRCSGYFTGEGCSLPDSYLNEFFQRYWKSLYAEWQEIDQEAGTPAYYSALYDFYELHEDQFLTDYAVTSPEEDIAESWTFFMLAPKPEMTSIANEKILFFYEYPELVAMRQEILTRLCTRIPH